MDLISIQNRLNLPCVIKKREFLLLLMIYTFALFYNESHHYMELYN